MYKRGHQVITQSLLFDLISMKREIQTLERQFQRQLEKQKEMTKSEHIITRQGGAKREVKVYNRIKGKMD